MAVAKIRTQLFIECPYCGEGESRIDHLKTGADFGAWYCDECGGSYRGVRTGDGAEIELLEGKIRRVLIELSYAEDPSLKIVIKGIEFEDVKGVSADYPQAHEYYYNEGTCPINYLGVDQIKFKDDTDPHGIFKFIRVLTPEEAKQIREG